MDQLLPKAPTVTKSNKATEQNNIVNSDKNKTIPVPEMSENKMNGPNSVNTQNRDTLILTNNDSNNVNTQNRDTLILTNKMNDSNSVNTQIRDTLILTNSQTRDISIKDKNEIVSSQKSEPNIVINSPIIPEGNTVLINNPINIFGFFRVR